MGMSASWGGTVQGIYINGRRPASKKAVREAVRDNPQTVELEATSFIPGTEYNGPVTDAPRSMRAYFVGPDPYQDRRFYGHIAVAQDGKITVK